MKLSPFDSCSSTIRSLGLSALALFAWTASALAGDIRSTYVPEPPARGKDNHHQASARQHKELEAMIWAWVDNLAPHVATVTRQQLYGRFAEELQNQYSDHAVWRFRNEVLCLVKDELHMPPSVYREEGHKIIDGGGDIGLPLADELILKAVQSSGGVLEYAHRAGGLGPMRASHDRVMRHDAQRIGELRRACRRPLSHAQECAVEDLHTAVMRTLDEHLPVYGSSKHKSAFKKRLMEALVDSDTARAVAGVRTRLKEAHRPVLMHGKHYDSLQACLRADQELVRMVEERMPSDFWARLARCHGAILEDPDGRAAVFEREGFARGRDSAREKQAEPSGEEDRVAGGQRRSEDDEAAAEVDSPAPDDAGALAVGSPFLGFETGKWHRIESPFGARPSFRYTFLVFYSEGSRPSVDDGRALSTLHDELFDRGIDCVAVTVLSPNLGTKRMSRAELSLPWVSIEMGESIRLGFDAADAGTGVLVDPSGRVVWRGPADRALEEAFSGQLECATLPRDGKRSKKTRDVRRHLARGRFDRALAELEGSTSEEAATLRAALESWIDGRIALARDCLADEELEKAERLVDSLEEAGRAAPWRAAVSHLRRDLRRTGTELDVAVGPAERPRSPLSR